MSPCTPMHRTARTERAPAACRAVRAAEPLPFATWRLEHSAASRGARSGDKVAMRGWGVGGAPRHVALAGAHALTCVDKLRRSTAAQNAAGLTVTLSPVRAVES